MSFYGAGSPIEKPKQSDRKILSHNWAVQMYDRNWVWTLVPVEFFKQLIPILHKSGPPFQVSKITLSMI